MTREDVLQNLRELNFDDFEHLKDGPTAVLFREDGENKSFGLAREGSIIIVRMDDQRWEFQMDEIL